MSEFPGGLAVKDLAMSLLCLGFNPWLQNFHIPQGQGKKKKKKTTNLKWTLTALQQSLILLVSFFHLSPYLLNNCDILSPLCSNCQHLHPYILTLG